MNIRYCFSVACAAALLTGASIGTAQANNNDVPNVRDGLVKVKSQQLDALYLLPGTDFRGYTKVLLDQAQVTFRNDWVKNNNQSTSELAYRVSSEDVERTIDEARRSLGEIFRRTLEDAGFEIVTAPGANVLTLAPRVVDMYVNAPDKLTATPSTRVFTVDAGEATLVLEIRDSTTGKLLGHATDHRTAGRDRGSRLRITSNVLSRGEFEDLFRTWAQLFAEDLKQLKARPSVAIGGKTATQ